MKFLKPEHIEKTKQKFSHIREKTNERKTLYQHIEEIKNFGREAKKYFDFDWNIFEFFAEFHDLGELNPQWNVGKRNTISHSAFSLYYTYLYYKDSLEKIFGEDIFKVLLFLIYRHHSHLKKRSCSMLDFKNVIKLYDIKLPENFFEEIRETIEKIEFENKVKIVDTFGIFKLCDILSARSIEENIFDKLRFNENPEKFIEEYVKSKNNSLNKEKLKIQKEISQYDDVLLIAPTGWGKTVSSILFFKNKLLITLPTITATKDFYDKIRNTFGDKVEMYFYLRDAFLFHEVSEEELDEERLFSYELAKYLFYPIMITTVDQILLLFLQAGKYYIRRFNLYGASIVLDEIHLLNPEMLYTFLYFYKKYKNLYNLRLLAMSATLPKAVIEFIRKEVGLAFEERILLEEYKIRRRIMFKYFEEDILNWIRKNVEFFNQNKKFLIIVNTINKSQEVYKILKERFKNVILLHSRFLVKDRFDKEEKLKNELEKGENRNTPLIFIATQVAEVSLDISLDFLLTELAPIPSLIQRFGRINRNGDITDKINVYIFEPNEIKELERKRGRYVYQRDELEIAKEIIKKLEEDNLKNEYQLIEELNKIYRLENLEKSLKENKIKEALSEWEREFNYFFTSMSEDETTNEILDTLFNLRGSMNVFVMLDPRLIDDDNTRYEILDILNDWERKKEFEEKRKLFFKLKNYIIPIPIWLLKTKVSEEKVGFPVIYSNKFRYSSEYGLYLTDKELVELL